MIVFSGQVILLDVEGTTFYQLVHDILFGYAKKHIASFLREHSHDHEVYEIAQMLAQETGVKVTFVTGMNAPGYSCCN